MELPSGIVSIGVVFCSEDCGVIKFRSFHKNANQHSNIALVSTSDIPNAIDLFDSGNDVLHKKVIQMSGTVQKKAADIFTAVVVLVHSDKTRTIWTSTLQISSLEWSPWTNIIPKSSSSMINNGPQYQECTIFDKVLACKIKFAAVSMMNMTLEIISAVPGEIEIGTSNNQVQAIQNLIQDGSSRIIDFCVDIINFNIGKQ
jgi:hypothetical protein